MTKCFCDFANPCYVCSDAGKAPKWLSIIWKGKMVEIDGKGRIRAKRKKAKIS